MSNSDAQAWGRDIACAGRKLSAAYQNPVALKLVKAVVLGDAAEVAELAAKGANVNYVEPGAVPPLVWALCADNIKGFEALLKAGADPNLAGDGHGWGDGKGHDLMEDTTLIYPGQSAMLLAAGTATPDFLKLAIAHGGDLDAAKGTHDPNRPLVIAADSGLFDNIKALLQAGADINAHDEKYQGQTAPEFAIGTRGRYDIAVWLLQQGYSHQLQDLASTAESRAIPTDGEQQRWKELLIRMLREKGIVFPASPGLKGELERRIVLPEAVEDLIMGRRDVLEFPLKSPPCGFTAIKLKVPDKCSPEDQGKKSSESKLKK